MLPTSAPVSASDIDALLELEGFRLQLLNRPVRGSSSGDFVGAGAIAGRPRDASAGIDDNLHRKDDTGDAVLSAGVVWWATAFGG